MQTASKLKPMRVSAPSPDITRLAQSVHPDMDKMPSASAEDCIKALKKLPPMRRLFMVQRLSEMGRGEEHIFDGTYSPAEVYALYEEWLSGFHADVIEAFESGKWEVRI